MHQNALGSIHGLKGHGWGPGPQDSNWIEVKVKEEMGEREGRKGK